MIRFMLKSKYANPKKIIKENQWGRYEQFLYNETGTLKLVYIKSGEKISLQSHKTRDEFWKVLQGNPIIFLGPSENVKKIDASVGDEFYIPKNIAHQAEAPSGKVLLLAISYGHFNPKDKVRIDDKYGRQKTS